MVGLKEQGEWKASAKGPAFFNAFRVMERDPKPVGAPWNFQRELAAML
jgi:hypothetical protein